jgi:hypothetical protein
MKTMRLLFAFGQTRANHGCERAFSINPKKDLIDFSYCWIANLQHYRSKSRAIGLRSLSGLCFPHPSWNTHRPVEYWCYNSRAAISRYVPLKDIVNELKSWKSVENELLAKCEASQTGSQSHVSKAINRWLIFPGRDEETAAALSAAFEMDSPDFHTASTVSRAKVEFIVGATRGGDHLRVSVQDLRLQENDDDGVEGHVDDVTWIQVLQRCNTSGQTDSLLRLL